MGGGRHGGPGNAHRSRARNPHAQVAAPTQGPPSVRPSSPQCERVLPGALAPRHGHAPEHVLVVLHVMVAQEVVHLCELLVVVDIAVHPMEAAPREWGAGSGHGAGPGRHKRHEQKRSDAQPNTTPHKKERPLVWQAIGGLPDVGDSFRAIYRAIPNLCLGGKDASMGAGPSWEDQHAWWASLLAGNARPPPPAVVADSPRMSWRPHQIATQAACSRKHSSIWAWSWDPR